MSLALRADIAREARTVVPQWPLGSFIAVNPAGGSEDLPFDSAPDPSLAFTRSAASYRVDLACGRITRDDLLAAVLECLPELHSHDVVVGGTAMSAAELLVAELLGAPDAGRDEGEGEGDAGGDGTSGTGGTGAPEHPAVGRLAPRADPVNELASSWVAAFLDPEPLWPMPHREHGFYRAWRSLAAHDTRLPRSVRRAVKALPLAPDAAISEALIRLSVTPEATPAALRRELAGLPGWTAHIKWRSEHVNDIDLLQYLAVRLSLRSLLGGSLAPVEVTVEVELAVAAQSVPDDLRGRATRLVDRLGGADRAEFANVAHVLGFHPLTAHPFTLQRAYELHYSRALVLSLAIAADAATAATAAVPGPAATAVTATAPAPATDSPTPRMQFVACIDPRSEGIRRHLERQDARLETFGFAGFFGVPIRFASHGSSSTIDALPALLSPRHRVTEAPVDAEVAGRRLDRFRDHRALSAGVHAGESTTAAPFAFAEMTGWLFGASAALRTFAPAFAARASAALSSAPALDSAVTVAEAFGLDERVGLAEASLRMMGMGHFAPLVILAGHGSTSTNNLYESALDCGACGGNPGDANARAAAAILNDPEVRDRVRMRGLDIPGATFFLAAEHDTVSDRISVLDRHLVPASHRELVAEFDALQSEAADGLIRERAKALPGASAQHSPSRLRRRADDWAEVYPEWGLVGNAAFIVAPREVTQAVDLERRVFLHSYDPALDPTGAGLETILTAPLVVAQWINHQYYFSAINPETAGAGTKTVHNAIGSIGVLSGQGGDLRRGLPWQSVGLGGQLVHEPMRLAAFVQAPLTVIAEIVARNAVLRSLFDNRWITLTARENADSPWVSYGAYGWTAYAPAPSTTHEGAQK